MAQINFEVSLTTGPDAELRAAYIHLRRAKVTRTEEVIPDVVMADYDQEDRLIGIEMLGPAKVRVLAQLIDEEHRPAFRRFVRDHMPPSLIAA